MTQQHNIDIYQDGRLSATITGNKPYQLKGLCGRYFSLLLRLRLRLRSAGCQRLARSHACCGPENKG